MTRFHPRTLFAALALFTATVARAQDVNESDEKAMKAAALKVAPSIVKIETSGGSETVGARGAPGMIKGTGATTGLIVGADGYVITSAFNFANKPTDIFVSVPGRPTRLVAKIVAQDQTRMLTLLKVDAKDLPVPAPYPKGEVQVGQWSLALGRTLDPHTEHPPSISAGIVSAKNRIWGKALQTDAKVSPTNYGGPLVALDGRVFGVLVPAATRGEGETAGVEWYDSGIGFAIPLEDVLASLPRLKQGKDLRRGLLGVTPKNGEDMYNAPAVIGSILPDSAASKIGLKPDDTITMLDGKPVPNYSSVMHVLGPKYEGDVIEVRVKRAGKDGKEETFEKVTLQGTQSAFVNAFLGILPMRDDPGPGVEVRYVYPKSPADTAGIKAGDRLMKIGAGSKPTLTPVANRAALTTIISRLGANTEVTLEVKRKEGGKTDTVTTKLVAATDVLPDKLPLPSSAGKALEKSKGGDSAVPMPPAKKGTPLPKKKDPKLPEPPKKPDTGLSPSNSVAPEPLSVSPRRASASEPEGLVLSAQAEGLGAAASTRITALKGPFIAPRSTFVNDPYRVENFSTGLPRPSAWADRTSPSGSEFETVLRQDEPKKEEPKKDDAKKDEPKAKDKEKPKVETGLLKRTNAALGREYWVFVPENYDPNVSHGLMVWFHDAGRGVKDAEDMQKIWEFFCEDHHFIMMGSKSRNNDGWVPSETEAVMEDVKKVLGEFTIDRSRVLAHGMGVGGQMAFYVGFNARDVFRGVATVGAVLGTQPKDNVADRPLSFFISGGDKDPLIKEIRQSKDVLLEKKFPVFYREMKDTGKQYFLTDVFDDLKAWMDSLDRI